MYTKKGRMAKRWVDCQAELVQIVSAGKGAPEVRRELRVSGAGGPRTIRLHANCSAAVSATTAAGSPGLHQFELANPAAKGGAVKTTVFCAATDADMCQWVALLLPAAAAAVATSPLKGGLPPAGTAGGASAVATPVPMAVASPVRASPGAASPASAAPPSASPVLPDDGLVAIDTVRVRASEIVRDRFGKAQFVRYAVQFACGASTWTVRRRFSEFVTLNAALLRAGRRAPPLPPKFGCLLFVPNKFGDDWVLTRRQRLEEYLLYMLVGGASVPTRPCGDALSEFLFPEGAVASLDMGQ